MRSHAVGGWARYAGALALLGVGLDHLEQFWVDSCSAVPTMSTLSALNPSLRPVMARCRQARPAGTVVR